MSDSMAALSRDAPEYQPTEKEMAAMQQFMDECPCCERDREDKKKEYKVRAALRASDPVK